MDVADPNPRGGRGFWKEAVTDWAAAQLHNTLTGVEARRRRAPRAAGLALGYSGLLCFALQGCFLHSWASPHL